MNIKGIKLLLASAFGMSLMGLSQIAAADWEPGACPQPHAGPAPCIEREVTPGVFEHFNGSGDHADDWHGPFTFTGESQLSCSIGATCALTLEGNVKKFQDANGDWKIGLEVTDGDVGSGTFLCGTIDIGGFPWFLGDTSTHDGFGPNTGADYSFPLAGNLGEIDLTAFSGLVNVEDAHIHNVTFNNAGSNPSYFAFDGDLYENGDADDNSGCSVDGDLYVTGYEDVNIY